MSKPYLPHREPAIDDDEFALFCEMSEQQVDAEMERVNSEFAAMLAKMTPLQEYRYWRRYILTTIMANRRRLRNPSLTQIEFVNQLWRDSIRKSQQSLLKHRHHLHTGVWPGNA